MDHLLKQNPMPLADERVELFALLDRFVIFVNQYRKKYGTIMADRNSDLQAREKKRQNALAALKENQNRELESLLANCEKDITDQKRIMEQWQNKTVDTIQRIEEEYATFERNEKQILENYQSYNESTLSEYCSVRDELQQYLNGLENVLGVTMMGNSKLDKILSSMTISDRISNRQEAQKAVSQSQITEVNKLWNEIIDINESELQKLLFSGKRNENIGSIAERAAKAESAVVFFRDEFRKEQQKKAQLSKESCKRKRTECNNKKEAAIKEKDINIQKAKELIQKRERRYASELSNLKLSHSQDYRSQEVHHGSQISEARRKWDENLVKCNETFAAEIKPQFPADRMNAWLRQFWVHPKMVEDYSKVTVTQMNVLVGVAEIDISGWYSGNTGETIKKVLAQYYYLFGTNLDQAKKNYYAGKFHLPYSISLERGTSVLFSHDNQCSERAKELLNAIGMRMLRSVEPCMLRFQLFDANGIGAFSRLLALDPEKANNQNEPSVVSIAIGENGKIHSGQAEISRQIQDTKIKMDDLSSQLINYTSLRHFNNHNTLSKQIYRPVLMMNFPAGLTDKEIRMMNAMTMNCKKWGFSMMLAQPDKEMNGIKPEIEKAVRELQHQVVMLRMDHRYPYLKEMNAAGSVEKAANIYLYGLPEDKAVKQITYEIRKRSVDASRVKIEFCNAKGICPQTDECYTYRADNGIMVPVGYQEDGQLFGLQFDDKHVHTMILGRTGSGKTNLLHVLMTNLMLRYGPDEVSIYLIDYKYSLDFRVYASYNLPNFRSISINSDPEFALAILEHLEKEKEYRSDVMGTRYQKISEYNADHPGHRLHRILLIIDELYELVKQAPDDIQKVITSKIDSLAHNGRAFGIHMVISGQDLHEIDRFETIKSQCATTIAFQCEEKQVKLLMGENGVARMNTIDPSDQGACVFSLASGNNPKIQHTAYLEPKSQNHLLQEIHNTYRTRKSNAKVLLTKVSNNPNHVVQLFVDRGVMQPSGSLRLYVGELISMEKELYFQPTENVWVVGGVSSEKSVDAAGSFLFFSAISLMMEKLKTRNMEIVCTNCNDHPLRSDAEEEADRLGQLTSKYPKLFHYYTANQLEESLTVLLKELDNRRNNSAACQKPIWWLVARPEIAPIQGKSNLVIDLKELLHYGPQYNIHVLMYNGDIGLSQKFQLNKSFFKERVCLEMSAEESKQINEGEVKSLPSGYKAVLIGQNTMRFRIYDLPDGRWMGALDERLMKI